MLPSNEQTFVKENAEGHSVSCHAHAYENDYIENSQHGGFS